MASSFAFYGEPHRAGGLVLVIMVINTLVLSCVVGAVSLLPMVVLALPLTFVVGRRFRPHPVIGGATGALIGIGAGALLDATVAETVIGLRLTWPAALYGACSGFFAARMMHA